MRYSRISLFLASRSLSSSSHFAASLLLPGAIVQSSWNEGAASCGPSNTTGRRRVGFDFMTSSASAPCKEAICVLLAGSSAAAVAAARAKTRFLISMSFFRWFVRSAASSFEDVAVAARLAAEPLGR